MTDDVTSNAGPFQGAFRIDEAQVRGHVDKLVRESVEQTLNGLLETEVKRLYWADKDVRTDARKDTRAGSYPRKLQTTTGEVALRVPQVFNDPPQTSDS